MKTKWADEIDKNNVLAEYPRPQLRRDSYMNLNGIWQYAITKDEKAPEKYDGEILVPFSPESELSGVERMVTPEDTLWYEREIIFSKEFYSGGRVILHFGAVDQVCEVYLNGAKIIKHEGGYTAFEVDITQHIKDVNTLIVKVKDYTDTSYYSRGKQKTKKGGIWYTPQSGIWQSVWAECVPDDYISSIRITPLYDSGEVEVQVNSKRVHSCRIKCGAIEAKGKTGKIIKFKIDNFISWSPANPYLYEMRINMCDDEIHTYFGMRKFSVDTDDKGIKRLFLNNAPFFHNGILDQGYYSDGLYTPASDDAMIYDITLAKEMGFNMLRKHIKIEPLRWYYHCDRLGIIVWQDMINGGGKYNYFNIHSPLFTNMHAKDSKYRHFSRQDEKGRKIYYAELTDMINQLYNCTSIAMWVPFNEAWGQFDSKKAVDLIKSIDTTRTIDHASGWCDQGIGEIQSRHVYFEKYSYKPDKLGRAVVLSEFGGYNCKIDGHSYSDGEYGYKKTETVDKFARSFEQLYMEQIKPAKKAGLSAAVYTQLTDVEDEVNGFVTYDRRVEKMDREFVRKINEAL